jgi:serine kinase of HPr protein (carbohydrate metabolism regulator)
VVSLLLRISMEHEAERLHLHVGHVAWQGRGVLVAGTDGSGKSTLVAKLPQAGFDYFTEEMVGVDRALALSPFPKPRWPRPT